MRFSGAPAEEGDGGRDDEGTRDSTRDARGINLTIMNDR